MQVLIVSHSWGETVGRNFLDWVDCQEAGWTEKHVAVLSNIAGCPLGAPKVRWGFTTHGRLGMRGGSHPANPWSSSTVTCTLTHRCRSRLQAVVKAGICNSEGLYTSHTVWRFTVIVLLAGIHGAPVRRDAGRRGARRAAIVLHAVAPAAARGSASVQEVLTSPRHCTPTSFNKVRRSAMHAHYCD